MKSREYFNIQKSIDNLANKFTELENAYYGFLQKSQEENENIIKKEADLSSEFFQSLLKEQTYLQNNIKHLTALEKSYNEELKHLRASLPELREEPSGISPESLLELQRVIEYSLNNLMEGIFNTDGLENMEERVVSQIERHFEEAVETISQAFPELPQVSKQHIEEILNLDKIEEIYSINAGLLDNLDLGLDTFKKITAISLKEIDRLSIDFTKEAQALQGNIEQGRLEVAKLAKGTKTTQKQKRDAEAETTPGLKNACGALNQLLSEALTSDTNKNQAFVSTRSQTEEISKALRYYIKDTKKYFETLKGNNQGVKAVVDALKGQGETKTGTFPNREEEQKDARNQRPFVETRGGTGPERIGGMIGNKEGEEISVIKSPISDSPWEIKEHLLENKLSQQGISTQDIEKALAHLHEMEERIGDHVSLLQQRIELLKSSYRSFISSTGKMIRFLPRKGGEEEFAVKACDNDKRIFETHLKTLEEIIVQIQENIRVSVPGKVKGKRLDAGYPEKGSANSLKSHDHKKKTVSKKGKAEHKVKPLAGAFEAEPIQKSMSPTHSKGELRKSPTGHRAKEMASTNPEGGWQRTTTPGARNQRDASPELQSLEFELVLLQKRNEELGKERDRLKKELGNIKKQPTSIELLPKIQELAEHNDRLAKDNATLVKVAKKLDQKVEERKKNLKKMFEVLTEKEKELNFYKAQYNKANEGQQQLTTQSQEDKGRGRATEKHDNERQSSKEDMTSLQRKSNRISDIISQISSSPYSQVPRIQELISFLQEEGADIHEKIKLSKSSRESRDVSLEKRSFRNTAKEPEEHKGKVAAQSARIQELEAEKNDLEERCDEMMKELEVAQDLRSKLEKNYRDEVAVLNDKVRQLNEYIEDMEAKNNDRLRNSVPGEKWRKNASSDRPVSSTPDREVEKAAMIDQLQNDIKALEERLEQFLESLGVENDDYQNIDIFGKLEVLYEAFQARVEEIVKEQEEAHEEANKEKGPSAEDMEEIRKKCVELEGMIDSYQTELNEKDADNKELADLLVARDKEIERLTGELQAKTEENAGYTEEIKSFEETLEKVGEEYQNHLEKLANTLANYGLPIDTTETDFAKFGEQLVNLVDSTLEVVANMREEEEKNKGKAAGGEQKEGGESQAEYIQELENANTELGEAVEGLKEQLDIREKEIEEILDEREKTEQEAEALKNNFEEMDNEIKKLRKENKQLKEEKDKLESGNKGNGPREVTHEQEAEISSLKELVAEKNANVVELKKALEEKEKVLGMMRGSVGLGGGGEGEAKKLKGILQEKESMIQQKDTAISEKIEQMELKEKELKEVKSKFNKRIDEINSKFWKETEQYNLKIQNLTKQIGKLKENLQTVNSELVESKEQKEKAEKHREELEQALDAKEQEIEELQYTIEQEKEEIQAQFEQQQEQLTQEDKGQVEDLKKELTKKEKIIAQLKEQKLSIQEELSGLYKEYEELEKQLNGLKEEKSAIEVELQDAKEELIKAQAHIEELVHQNEGLEEDLLEAKTEASGAQKEIKKLIREKLEAESQLEEFKEKLEDEQRYVEELSGEIEEMKEKLVQTIDQLNEVQKKNRESGRTIKQLEEDKGALEKDLEDKVKELEMERHSHASKKGKEKDDVTAQQKLEGEITKLEGENKALSEEKEKLNAQVDELESKLYEMASLEEELAQTREEADQYIEELETVKGHIEEYEKFVEEAREQIQGLQETIEENEKELEQKTNALNEAKTRIKQFEEDLQEAQGELLMFKETVKKEGEEEEDLKNLVYEHERVLEQKTVMIQGLSKEIESYREQLEARDAELLEALDRNVELTAELEEARKGVQQQDEGVLRESNIEVDLLGGYTEEEESELNKGVQEEVKTGGEVQQTQEIEDMKESIVMFEAKMMESRERMETLEGEREGLIKENFDLKEEINKLERQVFDLKEELEAKDMEIEEKGYELEQKYEIESENLRASVTRFEAKVAENKERISLLEQERNDALKEVDDLKEEIVVKEREVFDLKVAKEQEVLEKDEGLAQENEELRSTITVFEHKVTELRERFLIIENERDQAIRENKTITDQLVAKEREVFDLKTEKEQALLDKEQEIEHGLVQENEELKASNAAHEHKLHELRERISVLETERDDAIKENEEVKDKIEAHEREIFDLKATIELREQELQESEHQTTQENEDLRTSVTAFETKLTHARETIASLQTQRDEALSENNIIKDQLGAKEREVFDLKVEKEQALLEKEQEIEHGLAQENEDLKSSVAAYEHKVKELRERISVLETERDDAIKEISEVKDTLEAKERELFDLKAETEQVILQEKEDYEKRLTEEAENIQTSVTAIEEKLHEARERITALEGERDAAIRETEEVKETNLRQERELFDLKADFEQQLKESKEAGETGINQEIEDLKAHISTIEAQLHEANERVIALEKERDEIIREKMEIQEAQIQQERELFDLKETLEEKEKELSESKEAFEKKSTQEDEGLKTSVIALEAKLTHIHEQISVLEKQRDEAISENNIIKDNLEAKEREIFDLKAELEVAQTDEKLIQEHESLKISFNALEEKETHNQDRITVLETERDEAIQENSDLRSTIEAKETEINELKSQNEHLDAKNKEVTELNNRISELEKELGEVKAQNHNLLVEVEADDDEMSTMKAVLTEREEEIEQGKTRLTEKEEEITRITERISELERERDHARAECEKVRTEFITYQEESRETLAQKDQELLDSQAEYMTNNSVELVNLRTKLEADLESLKVHLSGVEKENELLKKEVEEKKLAIEGYEKEIFETKQVLTEKEAELSASHTVIVELEKEREEHGVTKETANLAEKEKIGLTLRLKELDEAHTLEIANLERNLEDMEEKVLTYEKEINVSKIRAAEAQKEFDRSQKEVSSLKEIVQQKDTQLEESRLSVVPVEKPDQQSIEMLRAERDMLQREIEVREEQYNANLKDLSDGVAEISAALKEKEHEIETLTAKLHEYQRKSEARRDKSPNDKSPLVTPPPFAGGHDFKEFEAFEDQFDQFEDFEDSFNEDFKKSKAGNMLNQSIRDLQEKNDKLEKERTNVLQLLEQSKETEATLRTQIAHLSPQKSQFESTGTHIGESSTGLLEKEITELKAAILAKDAEIADARTNGAVQIEKVRAEYRDELDQANEEIMALRDRNGEILTELEGLQTKYDTSINLKNAAKLENDRLTNDVKQLNIKLENMDAELKELKEKEGYLSVQLRGMGERSPEFSPVSKQGLNIEKVSSAEDFSDLNDPEQLKKKLADYERKFEKLRVERRTIKETNNSLKDENKDLRQNVLMFQQQIVMLSQGGKVDVPSTKDTGIVEATKESLKGLQGMKAFSGRFDFKIEDGAEVRKIMGFVKETLEANEKEISRLNINLANELRNKGNAAFEHEREELIKTAQFYKDIVGHKLNQLSTEILDVLADAGLELAAIDQRLSAVKELTQDEKVIYSALNLLRRYHREVEEELSGQHERPPLNLDVGIDKKLAKNKDDRIPSQTQPSNVKGTPSKKEYEEEVKESPFKATPSKPQKPESYRDQPSLSSPDDTDDAKARSFLEEETMEVNKGNEALEQEEILSEERHQIQSLYQQIRKLQDDHDKLDSEHRQLKNDYEIIQFLCEDLKAEIAEKDERIAKLLENIMTNEAGNAGNRELEQNAVHEKEHLRKIFLKFLDSALQGSKDAEDLFKVLLTLLQVPEEDKNYIIQGFKSKSKSKKGMFSKMFK